MVGEREPLVDQGPAEAASRRRRRRRRRLPGPEGERRGAGPGWRWHGSSPCCPDFGEPRRQRGFRIERLLVRAWHGLVVPLAWLDEDYHSEQPLFPLRAQGVNQARADSSALLDAIPDFQAGLLRAAVDDDTLFTEVRRTGTKADGVARSARVIVGIRGDRIAWARLYIDEVEREGGGHRTSAAVSMARVGPRDRATARALHARRAHTRRGRAAAAGPGRSLP
jgi:hypothetical protein